MDSSWGIRFNPLYGAPVELHDEILRRYPFTVGDVVKNSAGRTGYVEHVASDGNVWVETGRFIARVEHWDSDQCELVDTFRHVEVEVDS